MLKARACVHACMHASSNARMHARSFKVALDHQADALVNTVTSCCADGSELKRQKKPLRTFSIRSKGERTARSYLRSAVKAACGFSSSAADGIEEKEVFYGFGSAARLDLG